MSLNIIVNTDITETAKELLKLIAEEKKSKDDWKSILIKLIYQHFLRSVGGGSVIVTYTIDLEVN